jgi:hypothetical protein
LLEDALLAGGVHAHLDVGERKDGGETVHEAFPADKPRIQTTPGGPRAGKSPGEIPGSNVRL